jgi:hypothetical protein
MLCAAHLPSKALHIGDAAAGHQIQPYCIGWAGGLTLTPAHMQALAGKSAPSLESLRVADCSLLRDQDVAALVNAVPGLQNLKLERASGLTDSSLYALLGCKRLQFLYLGGCGMKITVDGVGVMLKLLKLLREVWVGGVKLCISVPEASAI